MWSSCPCVNTTASTSAMRFSMWRKSGRIKSTPGCWSSGNSTPQSTISNLPLCSNTVMLRPISPIPPSATTRRPSFGAFGGVPSPAVGSVPARRLSGRCCAAEFCGICFGRFCGGPALRVTRWRPLRDPPSPPPGRVTQAPPPRGDPLRAHRFARSSVQLVATLAPLRRFPANAGQPCSMPLRRACLAR